jgi:rhodanese-related sulfurtransferase
MKSRYRNIILAIIFGAVSGALVSFMVLNNHTPSREDMVKDFYFTENEVHVSPHHIRKAMTKGDESFILVDLRSQEEYEREHVVGAVSVPAYKTPDKSAYGDVERIVGSFKKLESENPDKEIIIYCYSIPCMTGRKIGKMLAEHEIYVKHLGVGWNEWRYFWTLWNHPHEWNTTNVGDYVISGSEPGEMKEGLVSKSCPIEGEFGC